MKLIGWPVQAFVFDAIKSAVKGPTLIFWLAELVHPFESVTVKIAVATSVG